jgi:hypothetical protein
MSLLLKKWGMDRYPRMFPFETVADSVFAGAQQEKEKSTTYEDLR